MKKYLFVALFFIIIGGQLSLQSARTFYDQLPLSIPTDPDKDRPSGRCNEGSDCPPGSSCTSFGWCEYE